MRDSDEAAYFEIAVDKTAKGALLAAIHEAASDDNISTEDYSVSDGSNSDATSELQFEPLSTSIAAAFVVKLVVSGTASYFVRKALDKFLKQERPKIFILVGPSGQRVALDPLKPEQIYAALKSMFPDQQF
jgi:hypothetical protein